MPYLGRSGIDFRMVFGRSRWTGVLSGNLATFPRGIQYALRVSDLQGCGFGLGL